jgi:hypothetical protein
MRAVARRKMLAHARMGALLEHASHAVRSDYGWSATTEILKTVAPPPFSPSDDD